MSKEYFGPHKKNIEFGGSLFVEQSGRVLIYPLYDQ